MRIVVTAQTASVCEVNTSEVDVENTATLLSLKHDIAVVTGIPVDQQWIIGPCGDLIAISGTLGDCGLHEGATLWVRQDIWFFVRGWHGNCIHLVGYTFETVGQAKLWMQNKTGIPMQDQELSFDGHVLQDDLTLGHCNITDRAIVDLLRMSGPLFSSL